MSKKIILQAQNSRVSKNITSLVLKTDPLRIGDGVCLIDNGIGLPINGSDLFSFRLFLWNTILDYIRSKVYGTHFVEREFQSLAVRGKKLLT